MTVIEPVGLTVSLPIAIRPATADDLPLLEWYGQYKHYRRLFRRTFQAQQDGRRLMLVADCNAFPIGQIFIQFNCDNSRIADGEERGYLFSLRVMQMFQRQGIGTRLVQQAETILSERGYHYATIAVAKSNNNARRLYHQLGYGVFAEDPGTWSYVDHKGKVRQVDEPCWVLEKSL
jgi:ribosomal protein S18 acetylase RimI-like enzyme